MGEDALVLHDGRLGSVLKRAGGRNGVEREEALVPFQTASLVGAKVLVLAPHPDDETMGCGGSLALHRAHGDPVKVLVLTDGARASGPDAGEPDYIALRERETRSALDVLGIHDVEFWRLPDRALTADAATVARLESVINEYRPTLLYVPSPLEPHPDHVAAAHLVWAAIRQTDIPLGLCLYEVGLPIRPNTLVDITPVLSQKERALDCYTSQLALNDYRSKILGLNRYRSYTLPAHVTHAEAFWRLGPDEARAASPELIRWQMAREEEGARVPDLPLVSVIVRTFNRPRFLQECLQSILAQTYRNIEVVVVNDGGQDVEPVLAELRPFVRITAVVHEQPAGRPKALNAGLSQAKGDYIAYLDDDDIYYPDHIETLVNFLRAGTYQVAYTDVRSALQRLDPESGTYVTYETRQEFCKDFDPDWLRFENYIPINAVMHSRKVIEEVGPFDETMELLEDWELWIRMSRLYKFARVAKCTAEYRMRNDGTNVTFPFGRNRVIGDYTAKLFDKYAGQRLEAAQRIFEALKGSVYRLERDIEKTRADYRQFQDQAEQVIHQKEALVQDAAQEVQRLHAEIGEIQSSLAWWLARKIHQAKSRLFPSHSRRGKLYEGILRQLKELLKIRPATGSRALCNGDAAEAALARFQAQADQSNQTLAEKKARLH